MADVFGLQKTANNQKKIVSAAGILCTVDSTAVMLAQSLNLNYQRQTQAVYEIGSEDVWTSAGAASGTLDVGRAICEEQNLFKMFEGKGCTNPLTITFGAGNGNCTGKASSATCTGCYPQSIGLQTQAGGNIVTENTQFYVGCVEAS